MTMAPKHTRQSLTERCCRNRSKRLQARSTRECLFT